MACASLAESRHADSKWRRRTPAALARPWAPAAMGKDAPAAEGTADGKPGAASASEPEPAAAVVRKEPGDSSGADTAPPARPATCVNRGLVHAVPSLN